MNRTFGILIGWITAIIFFLYLKLFIHILYFDHKILTMGGSILKIFCQALFLLLLFRIYQFLSKHSDAIKKYQRTILIGFLILLFTIQLVVGNRLRVVPLYDFSAVYDGAVEWLVKGSFYSFYDYYYYYPNNLGALSFLTFFFRIAANMGCHDFYFVGMLINSLMCCAFIICTFLICKKLFSSVEAVFALFLYGLCPPMYLLAPVFYTDQLTMLFPVLIYLFFLLFEEKEGGFMKKEWYAFVIAAAGTVGFFLKPTVLIVIVGLLLTLLLKREMKDFFQILLNVVVVIVLFSVLKNSYFYSRHLDRETALRQNTPAEVWVYMGLNENPGFSPDDTEFARAISDPQTRRKIVREKITERIREYGFVGLYRHLTKKEVMAFSDGTFELSYAFLFGFVKETEWKEVLTTLGKYYRPYWDFCSLLWYAVLLLGIVYEGYLCIELLDRHKLRSQSKSSSVLSNTGEFPIQLFPVVLSVFGLYLFFLIWEIHSRYTVNYYGFFVILAVAGMRCLHGVE